MISVESIDNGLMAFFAGLIISPHCVGMCGPVLCTLVPMGRSGGEQDWNKSLYHLGRVISYTIVGAFAGALGLVVVRFFGLQPIRYLPWVLIALLLLFAFRLDRYLPRIPFLRTLFQKLAQTVRNIPRPLAGIGLGLATPALPCAPLYSLFWVALVTGSPLFGAEIALGFALGTIPLLWISQEAFLRLRRKIQPSVFLWIQRSVALVAAALILWRVVSAGGVPLATDICTLH